MNYAEFELYKTRVAIESYKTYVALELVRVESDFSFVSPYQVTDNPKERES